MMNYFGWHKDERDERDWLHTPRLAFVKRVTTAGVQLDLPEEVNWAKHVPPVRDQGLIGSCYGFALGGQFGFLARMYGVYTEWFSPTWIYNGARLLDNSLDRDVGTYPRLALKFVREYGALLERFWSYNSTRLDTASPMVKAGAVDEAARYPVISYHRVTEGVDYICSALAEGRVVTLGAPWYATWTHARNDGLLPENYGQQVGGHATLLYGYDRKRGLFYGQNSWGTDWGNYGRFLMPFSAIDAFLGDWGYDAHYVDVDWSEVEPLAPQRKRWWIWALAAAGGLAAAASHLTRNC